MLKQLSQLVAGSKCLKCFFFFCISCVKGKLVEVNEELVSNPNIMLEKVMPSTGKRLNVLLTALVTSLKNIGSLITCRVQDVHNSSKHQIYIKMNFRQNILFRRIIHQRRVVHLSFLKFINTSWVNKPIALPHSGYADELETQWNTTCLFTKWISNTCGLKSITSNTCCLKSIKGMELVLY